MREKPECNVYGVPAPYSALRDVEPLSRATTRPPTGRNSEKIMSEMSISELSALTGFTRETVGKRLADIPHTAAGNAKRYDPRQALPALYETSTAGAGAQQNLMVERAALAKAQRIKIEIETGVLQGRLLQADVVEQTWAGMTTAARARLLALPYRLAVDAIAADGVFARIESAAHELIREALEELHSYDPADYGPGGKLAGRQ